MEDPMVDKLVERLQALVIRTLQLDIPPSAIDPDVALTQLEPSHSGLDYRFDSVDLVEIVAAMESALDTELLEEDELQTLFARGTVRDLGRFLLGRFDREKLEAFCAAPDSLRSPLRMEQVG